MVYRRIAPGLPARSRENVRGTTMSDSFTMAQTFQSFVNYELSHALERFDHQDAAVYIYCHLTDPGEPSRRVLVITEANSARIAVCIEAAYELFAGDTHHYVRQVGTIA